jgi:fibronectin-binding autotransporter adhesin
MPARIFKVAAAVGRPLWWGLRNSVRMLLAGLLFGIVTAAQAQDGIWTPGSSDWNTAANWTPSTAVPTGVAEFGSATTTTLTFSNSASVGTLLFDAGAPAYSFNLATSSLINITGSGIINNSSNAVTLTTSNGGGLHFQNSSTAGSAILTTNSTGITSFEGASTGGQARVTTNAGGIFDLSGLTSGGMTVGSIAGAGTYRLGSNVLTIGNTLSTTVSGNIVDAGTFAGVGGGLTKVGTSTLTLSGVNTYTGGTLVSAGTLQAGATTGFSSSSAFTVNSVLDLAGFSDTVGSLAGSGNVTNSGASSATLSAGGDGTSTAFGGTLTDGASSLGLTKTGAGTLKVSGGNTYTGGTTVSGGTLQAGSTTGFSSGSAFTVNSVLDLAGFSNSVGSLAGIGNVTNSGGSPATLTAEGNGTSTIFSGTLADGSSTLGLTKTGAGTMTLTGADTYTGGTTISAGTLQIGNGGTSGTIAGNVTDNGTLAFNRTDNVLFPGIVSGTGTLKQLGTGILTLSGANTYSGGTTISAGTLQIGNGGTVGSIVGNVADTGSLVFNRTDNVTYSGVVSGAGTLAQNGAGTLILTGTNTLTGGTTIGAGSLQIGSGGGAGSLTGNVANSGSLILNRTGTLTLAGIISGTGTVTQSGTGTSILSGTSTYTGATEVSAGALQVTGVLGNTAVNVESGATLSGQGTIGGGVTIQNGGHLAPGPGSKSLNLGPLFLNPTSILDYQLGTAGSFGTGLNGYVKVAGNLNLDGVLNVTNAGSFGSGSYELINYTGALTNLGLTFGTIPTGFSAANFTLTTIFAGQIDLLVNQAGLPTQVWNGSNTTFDGTVHGGTGTWNNLTTNSNFIDAGLATSQSWQQGFAVFATTGGTVTLGDDIAFQGIQFTNNGYSVVGAGSFALHPTGTALLIANSGVTATISATLVGTGGVNKAGLGKLILTAVNTYTGGTTMSAGTLSVASDTNLGDLSVGLTFNGGELLAGPGFSSPRAVSIMAGGGTVASMLGGVASLSGIFTGTGNLTIGDTTNTGTVRLSGTNTYSGSTTISAGVTGQPGATLQALSMGALSSTSAFVVNGKLDLNGFSSQIGSLAGAITGTVTNTGSGSAVLTAGNTTSTTFAGVAQDGTGTLNLVKIGAGTLTMTGASTYSGGTTISAGTLQIGNAGTIGSIAGDVIDNANFVFSRTDALTFGGVVSGTGTLSQIGTGTLTLTGADTYTGGTTISAGTLQIGDGVTSGSIVGNVTDNASLSFNPATGSAAFAGIVSGTGSLSQIGPGTLILTGANIYTGGTTISTGTLQIGNAGTTGSLGGNVTDNANLSFSRTDNVTFPGIVSGTGALTQIGTGTLILTAADTYTGGTTISAGTLQIGNAGTIGSIVGNVTDNSNLAFSRTNALTFSGVVSGTGMLSQIGSGTLTLSGTDTYSGGTTISSGTLQVGNGGTTGSIVGDVIDNANFAYNRTDTVLFPGVVSGTGSLSQTGTGTLTLTGADTYSGGTTISAGTLQIGNGGTIGSLVGNVTDNANLAFNHTDNVAFSGIVSGTGSLSQLGTGTLTLTAADTYTGGTTISAGTLQIGNGGTMGSVAGNVTDNANLSFNHTDGVTFAGVVSGTGSLSQLGTGTLTLTGTNTYTGGTTISAGTLQIGNGGTGGRIAGNVADSGILAFSRSNSTTFAGVVSGPGTLSQIGTGTLTLTGANTYTGGTTISAGTLQVGSAGTIGSLVGNVSDNANLSFNHTDNVAFSGIVSGTGILNQIGSGTLTLTGANTYAGGTTISAGTLQIGNGGTTGSLVGNVTDNSNLAFNHTDNVAFSGIVSGTGSLSQLGTGTLTLTAADTYTGGTTISAGTLQVGNGGTVGSIGGNVTDNSNLAFARSDNVSFAGVVSGTGTLKQLGTGSLTLTGADTFSGGTTISAGTLQIGNGGTTGSLVGNVTDNGSLGFKRTDGVVFAGNVSGTGTLSQSGTGILTLTGANTFSGGTTISAGMLQVGNGGTTGSVVGNVTDNGSLSFNRSDGVVFTGIVSGAGSLSQLGTGTLSLTGANIYTGGTTIGAGTLQIGNGGTTGSVVGNVTDNGSLAFDHSDNLTYSGTISGTGNLSQIGSGTLTLTGSNLYQGGTLVSGTGTVSVDNDAELGVAGGITLQGGELLTTGAGFTTTRAVVVSTTGTPNVLAAATGTTATYADTVSGPGALVAGDATHAGSVVFTGNNSYLGGTTINGVTLQIGNGGTSGSVVGNVVDNGNLAFDRSDPLTFAGSVSGPGTLAQQGAGTLILTGTSTYTGATAISAGTLQVDGKLGNTAVTVQSGSVLSGQGTIAGAVTIQNGGHLAPGPGAQTLSVGSLLLNSASILDYRLSTPGVIGSEVNSLVNAAGNLTLDGILNVTNGGGFGSGAYRLINYTGALTDLTLGLGTLPAGFTAANVTVTTGVAGQVNLVISATGAPTQFWDGSTTVFDGTVHGGNGTWNNFATNFTDFAVTQNQSWQNGVAIFSAAPGTVTLGDNILFQGMQFEVDGYTVAGAGAFTLQPTGTAVVTTDPGVTATITAPIAGPGGLKKAGLGLLSLTGNNTYSGGTTISAGVLKVGSDTNLGGTSGGLTLDGGELVAGDGFSSLRPVLLTANNGTLSTVAAGSADFQGNITGSGSLTVGDAVNTGTVQLSGTNAYLGNTTIVSGATLQALSTAALSSTSAFNVAGTLDLKGFSNQIGSLTGTGTVTDSGTAAALLTAGDSSTTTFSGVMQDGTASFDLAKIGNGTLFLTGANTYTGGTTIAGGFLLIGNGGTTGSIVGNVIDNANLGFNRQDNVTFSGNISGTGVLLQLGPGTLTLTGTNTYSGGTSVSSNSTLRVDSDAELGAAAGGIKLQGGELLTTGAAFSTARLIDLNPAGIDILAAATGTTATYAGVISDSKILTVGDGTHGGTVVLAGNNTYSGGTMVAGGVLSVAGDTNLGNLTGGVTLAGGELETTANFTTARAVTLTSAPSPDSLFAAVGTTVTYQGILSGNGALNIVGPGKVVLIAANTFSAGTAVSLGTLQIGNGGTTGSILGNVVDNGNLVFDHSDSVTFAGIVSGTGTLNQQGSGVLIFTGSSTYTGATAVSGGTLQVDGVLGNTAVTVQSSSVLSGQGTIGGSVTIQDGGHLAPGPGAQTLSVGSLVLNSGSILDYRLSTPGVIGSEVNSLVNVAGNLTLDGILNVTNGGGFGSGAYRLLNYTGALTDLTLGLGTLPVGFTAANVTVTTGVAGQVNLVISAAGAPTQFWDGSNTVFDGTVHGGNGTWNNFTTNFTNGTAAPNQSWQNGVLIFSATPGTVTLGDNILFQGMQFTADGYTVAGAGAFTLQPTGTAVVTTDPGVTATITASIAGPGGLKKAGLGLLSLTGVNTYSGGTTISGGALKAGSDTNLGDVSGGLALDGGELVTGNGFSSLRAVLLTANNGTLSTVAGGTADFQGNITGSGSLTVGDAVNTGVVELSGSNTYLGNTTIVSGATLQALATAALSPTSAFNVVGTLDLAGFSNQIGSLAGAGAVTNSGLAAAVLTAGNSTTTTFGGVLQDGVASLGLTKIGTGTLSLTGNNTYSGVTTIGAGTLQAGSTKAFSLNSAFTVTSTLDLNGFSNSIGSLAGTGTVTNNGGTAAILTAGGDATSTVFSGTLSNGSGSTLGLMKTGAGTLTLTGTNTYTGGTTITAGTLQIGNGSNLGSIVGDVVNNTALVFNRSDPVTFAGAISGTGNLSQAGSGTLVLTGTSTYTGATTVSSGVLQVDGVLGNTAVSVQSGTELAGHGTIGGSVTIQDFGHLAPGPGAQTLSVGSLFLNSASILGYQLSTPGVIGSGINTLVNVAGNLTLDGLLNVTNGGNFGSGSYRLINYGGTLTDLTLELGILPAGFTSSNVAVTTAVAGQVNLVVNAAGGPTQFWDGSNTVFDSTVHGGTGTWDNFMTNFTNGTAAPNQAWQNGVAVFAAAPGTVTLGADILFHGMQFTIGGYTVAGAGAFALHPSGIAEIKTDAGVTATIAAPVVGTGGLDKDGSGLLILAGANTYSGGTTISGGIMRVSSNTNLGDSSGGVTLAGGELETSTDFTSARTVALVSGNGANILGAAASTTATYTGTISGTGGLTVGSIADSGTVVLTKVNNSYTGGTTVSGATLGVVNDASLGDATGGVTLDGGKLVAGDGFSSLRSILLTANNGTLSTVAGGTADFQGNITGIGSLTVGDPANSGVVELSGTNSYLGSTSIVSGATLQALSTGALSSTSAFTVTGTLDLKGFSNQIGSLAGTGTVTNSGLVPAMLTAGDNGNTTFSGVLQDGVASLGLTKIGTGTLSLTGNNTYTGVTTISGGTLQAGATTAFSTNSAFTVSNSVLDLNGFSNTIGSLAGTGTVTNNGGTAATLIAGGDATSTVFSGNMSNGSSVLGFTKTGVGTLTLTGTNTYTGGTTITAGILQVGNGGDIGSIVSGITDNASLVINRSGSLTIDGAITGTGTVTEAGSGTLILTGTSAYTGATAVSAGTLQVDGVLGNTAVTVQSGAILSGQGTIGGDVTILNGGHLSPGPGAQTLSVGSLALNSGSILDYQLSAPGVIGSRVNSLVNVAGNLTLAGVLNVTDGGSFGSGSYRLINYTGALTDLTLTLGTLPADFSTADATVSTGVAGQVNLVVSAAAAPTQFWDGSNTVNNGTVHGGSGTWSNFATNFTNAGATLNQAWQNGVAVFSAAPGIVTLGADILFRGMQFTIDGYTVAGSGALALHPIGLAEIKTDAGVTATIAAPVVGIGGLDKDGSGLLILAGENTYSGGTSVSGGILRVSKDTNLGNLSGGVELNGGELETSGNLTTARTISVAPSLNGANTLGAAVSTTATYTGTISGTGGLTVGSFGDSGTVVLTNIHSTYTGGTTVSGATLSVAHDANLGDLSGGLTLNGGEIVATGGGFITFRSVGLTSNNGTLAAVAAGFADFQGNITGSGSLTIGDAVNTGIVSLSGTNTYLGSTTIVDGGTARALSTGALSFSSAFTVTGTLDLNGFSNQIGSLAGSGTVTNGGLAGALLTAGADNTSTTFSGILQNGTSSLGLTKTGTGTLTLVSASTYSEGTTISGGTLRLGNGGTSGSIVGDVIDNGNLVFNRSDDLTFSGVVSGTGNLTQSGPGGTLTLSGTNTYQGGTTVTSASAVRVSTDSNLGAAGGGIALIGGEIETTADGFATARTVTLTATAAANILGAALNTTATYSGAITGAGGLLIGDRDDPGTVALTNLINSYSGGTTVSPGATLSVPQDAALGNLSGAITLDGGELLATGGVFSSSRAIALTANNGTLASVALSNASFLGNITGGGNLTVGDPGNPGVVLLGGTNAYTGSTTILSGATLAAGSSGALSPTSEFNVNGTLDLRGFSSPIASLTGTGVVTNGGVGGVVNPAVLTVGSNNISTTFGGVLQDGDNRLGLTKTGSGTLTLTGTNTYTGVTTIEAGTLEIGDGGNSGSIVGDVVDGAALAINRSGSVTLPGAISGAGTLSQVGSGTLALTGTSAYTGATTVSAGTLQVDGVLENTAVTVQSGAILTGQGTIAGSVTIEDGGHLAPAPAAQTLSVGSLLLNAASILDYRLSTPGVIGSGVNSLVNVVGHLTLDGVLNVTNGGQFGAGSYRLLNYSGTLADLTLNLGTLPPGFSGNAAVTTGVAGEVNLVLNTPGSPTQFWDGSNTVFDGTVHGGTGTWVNFVTTNFIDFAVTANQAWQNGLAVFTAAPGTVTLGSNILFQGMQFATDGYTITGAGAFTLNAIGTATITTDSAGVTATITAPIAGSGGLNKSGPGVLILVGENTYSGGTTISGGVLRVASDTNLGALNVGLELNGGELETSADFTTARTITLIPGVNGANTLGAATNTTAIYTGVLSGTGGLTVGKITDSGTVVLTNVKDTYAGGTTVANAKLRVADDANLGDPSGGLILDGGELMATGSGLVTFRSVALTANGGTLAAEVAGLADFQGNITGSGALTIGDELNTGTVEFSGTNTYLGPTTIVSGTTLKALSTGALSSASAFIVTGTLDLNGFSNQIGSLAGTGTVTNEGLVEAALTAGDDNTSTTFSGVLQDGVGTLGLTKNGTGTLILTGKNTYSGGTVIEGGTLSVDTDTELGATGVEITLEGGELLTTADGFNSGRAIEVSVGEGDDILAAATGTMATYTGVLSGTGNLVVGDGTHTGTIVLAGNNTYSGGTNVFPGTLVAAGDNALGSGLVRLFNGTLIISMGVTLPNEVHFVAGGVLNNAGTLNNMVLGGSSGTETVLNFGFINGDVALGGTKDIVQLFTGSKIAGNLILSGPANSALILDGAGQQLLSLAVTGAVTDNGSLVKQGSGTWTIDRALAAPLGTDILAGMLVVDAALNTPQVSISAGATLQLNSGGSVSNLTDNGSLIFAGSETVSFGSVISGPGNVIQDGSGTTILSGRDTYTGGTIIDLGTLLVNNTQALGTGNVAVSGGVLGASGTQPINVSGNFTQSTGGTLQLNIAGRAPGQFGVLNVAGSAALNGTLRLLNLGYQPQSGDNLKLVSTGGAIFGRFAKFQNPFALGASFNTIDLVYARNSVTLEFFQTNTPGGVVSTTDFRSFALTPNQRAAASLLDAVQLDPRAANLIAFLSKEPFADLPGDFQKISPDGLSAFYEISFSNSNIQRLNLESRMDDLHNGSSGFSSNMKVNGATVNLEERVDADGKSSQAFVEPILQPGPENRWGVWMTGFGDFVSVDADANANGYDFTTGGVSLGIDYRISEQWAVGVMGEYSHTWTSLQPSGNIDVNSGRGGLYATWHDHGIYVNGAIYGGQNNYDSSRSGLQGLATGATEGTEWSTFISGGYDFHFGSLTVGPVAALQYTYAHIDGFSENGSLAPMQIQSDAANSLRSDVGFRLFYQWQVGKVIIEPSLKAAWEHEYLYSALPITAGFAGIPGPTATFTGPAEGHESAIVSAGVSVQWTPTLSTYLNYDGQLGRGNYSSNAVTGGVRMTW